MDKSCHIAESDTLIFSQTVSVSAISLTDSGVEIAKLRNDGAAEFNWPAIEKTAARWDAGSRDTWVSMARLLLLANNSAPTEYDAVRAERERWMKAAVAALDILDALPAWSNAGHACQLLREASWPNS